MRRKTAKASKRCFYTPASWLDRRVRVLQIGAGGNGAEMLDCLARMNSALRAIGHPGFHVTVMDGDRVSASNIVRQRFLPGDEGRNKAVALAQRYNLFFGLDWTAVPQHFAIRHAHEHLRGRDGYELLLTCPDKAAVRAEIGAHYADRYLDTLWLDLGNDAHDGSVILGHLGRLARNSERLANVFDLYPELATQTARLDADGPSCSAEEALTRQEWPINRLVATAASGLLWNLLRHGKLDHHGMFVDVRTGRMTPLAIDRQAWDFMGYRPGSAA